MASGQKLVGMISNWKTYRQWVRSKKIEKIIRKPSKIRNWGEGKLGEEAEAVVKSHPVLTHPELRYVIPVTLVQADLGQAWPAGGSKWK